MDMNEFLDQAPRTSEVPAAEELDVQKAVVESLAADKAEQDERIIALQRENDVLKSQVSALKSSNEEMKAALAKVGDVLAKNAETVMLCFSRLISTSVTYALPRSPQPVASASAPGNISRNAVCSFTALHPFR